MNRLIVTPGDRFGRLIVSAETTPAKSGMRRMVCRCDCGVTTVVQLRNLRSGHTGSCGCHRRENFSELLDRRHRNAVTGTPEHRAWINMKYRCHTATCRDFENYGGRGIRVCEKWRRSFAAFFADVGPRPSPKHSIDRFPNNDGHYEPGNVRWAIQKQQDWNKRTVRLISYNGERLPLNEWARRTGIPQATLQRRIVELHWPVERALSTPGSQYHHRQLG